MKDFVTAFIVLVLGLTVLTVVLLWGRTCSKLTQSQTDAQLALNAKDEEILHLNARIADLLDAVQDRDKTIRSWQMLTIELPVKEIEATPAPAPPPVKRTPRKETNKNKVVEE